MLSIDIAHTERLPIDSQAWYLVNRKNTRQKAQKACFLMWGQTEKSQAAIRHLRATGFHSTKKAHGRKAAYTQGHNLTLVRQ